MSALLFDRLNGPPVFWRIQLAGWGLFAVADLIGQRLLYQSLQIACARTALVTVCLLLMSTAMRSFYDARLPTSRVAAKAAALIFLLSLLGASAIATTIVLVHELVPWIVPPQHRGLEEFLLPQIHYFLALAGWSLAYFWIQAEVAEQSEHRRAVVAEAEALRAELEELRLQLDPHFLFNALNGVAEEIPEHPKAALAMLRDLTAYLRHSLDGIDHTVVTVEAEVAGLTAYLGVQKARFGDRLRTQVALEQAAAKRRIASFLLQPLVENAVKHGRRDHGLDLLVDIRVAGEALHVKVENNGALVSAGKGTHRRRSGIGLQNVRRRLALHYPERHSFDLSEVSEAPDRKKVVATLILGGEPCGS